MSGQGLYIHYLIQSSQLYGVLILQMKLVLRKRQESRFKPGFLL